MNGILHDTYAEFIDRKMLFVFVAVTAIAVLVVAMSSSIDMRIQISGSNGPDEFSGRNPATGIIVKIFGFFISLMTFLATMASASLIPNALERGRAEFYLTKPLSRSSFLIGKMTAIWIVYGGTVVACGAIVLIVSGLVHGFSNFSVYYLLGAGLINLAIWVSITVTVGVYSRSTPMAIMAAFLIWVAQYVLAGHEAIANFVDSAVTKYIVEILYYVIPKPSAILDQAEMLSIGETPGDWIPLGSSILFMIGMTVFGTILFKRREF